MEKKRDTIFPWGWEAVNRPTDLLMDSLQQAFLGDTPIDSCIMLVDRFHAYADRADALPIEKARATFWDGRLAFANEDYEESVSLFGEALRLTDSVRYPYDARYIHLCLEPLTGKVLDGSSLDWEWYMQMLDDLDYSLNNDACLLGAVRAQYLCCIMTYSGNPHRALNYALIADSLFARAERGRDRLTNRINVASNRILIGDTAGALDDYAWIDRQLEDGIQPVSPLLNPLIDYNKWIEGGDTAALIRLRNQTCGNPSLRGYDAVASAYLAEIELGRNDADSLPIRLRDMEAGLDMTDEMSQKAFVLKTLGMAYESIGRPDIALEYFNRYTEVAESHVRALSSDIYSVAEMDRQINQIEHQRNVDRINSRIHFAIIALIAAALAAVAAWLVCRVVRRLKKATVSEQRALEKAKRSELSMSLSVLEKERQIAELRKKISQLVDDEIINTEAAREIESSIRSGDGATKADAEFGKVFSLLSPDFHKRLREKYPRIGHNTLRMAEYIAIGMDNRHIALVMNIRPESVKQNRWRLRRSLGLETDESLDKILSEMI